MASKGPARQRYDETERELRSAESKQRELREEEIQLESSIEGLKAQRQTALLKLEHAAIDTLETNILHTTRQLERQRVLIAEHQKSLSEVSERASLLAREAAKEAAKERGEVLAAKAAELVAEFNVEIWKRGHTVLAQLYAIADELRTVGFYAEASAVLETLIPNQNALLNQGWKVRQTHSNARFMMHAATAPGEDLALPVFAAPLGASHTVPTGQFTHHPPPLAAMTRVP